MKPSRAVWWIVAVGITALIFITAWFYPPDLMTTCNMDPCACGGPCPIAPVLITIVPILIGTGVVLVLATLVVQRQEKDEKDK